MRCRMLAMKSWFGLFAVALGWGLALWASVNAESDTHAPVGYVACSSGEQFASMILDICRNLPAGRIGCGQSVGILARRGDWLEITFADGPSRYLPTSKVSRSADKFVPFDRDSGVEDKGAIDCPAPPKPSAPAPGYDRPPRMIYTPNPEYSPTARRKNIEGSVVLSLLVGTDGLPHNIKLEKGLGYGLDEKALETIQTWRFSPAEKDGRPVEIRITVNIRFHLY